MPWVGVGWRQPHYAELLQGAPAPGFLEVHSENFFGAGGAVLGVLMQAREHHAVSLHGVGLSLGSAVGLDPWHLDQLAELVARVDPVRVSDHASFSRGGLFGQTVHAADLLPIPWTTESLNLMSRHVQQVQDRLRRPLVIENLSAYLSWADNDFSEVQFLGELARRTGCGLLVDVNNLHVNARNAWRRRHGPAVAEPTEALLDVSRAWLDAVPAECVAEIHLAGHADTGEWLIDDHGSLISEPVWALYRHAVSRWGPRPTLIEWDTDLPPWAVLMDQARQAADTLAQVAP
ncbi:MAG: DUF692 domain-containing protein [Curvibacter sp.]|nr:MAG: DUF692 domain-containing protein [Curvibacter sp.]